MGKTSPEGVLDAGAGRAASWAMRFLSLCRRFLFPCFLPVMLASGCSADTARPAAPAAPAASVVPGHAGATLARIQSLAAAPSCTEDSQCHSLALGASPCGGPEGYIAWSSARTPADGIRALGRTYEAERRDANARSGMISNCRFTPDPGAVCRAGVCALGTAMQVH
jgi:hypothetical protein